MGNRIDDRGTRAINFRGYSWEDPTGADSSNRHRTAIREPRSGPTSDRDQGTAIGTAIREPRSGDRDQGTAIGTAIREPRSGSIAIRINDQVCDRDQVGVGHTMQPAIKNDHPVCATHVQDCHLLARATHDRGCPRYGDRDRVVGFDWLTLNRVEFALQDTRRILPGLEIWASRRIEDRLVCTNSAFGLLARRSTQPLTPPLQLRRNAEIQDRETAQVVRRLANQDHPAATLGERQGNQGDSRRASRHIGSSEAYPRDPAPPSIG
jgi:hypothetical protein